MGACLKLPSFQFYPGDWMKDANLRRCTAAEKGVWIDMLCLMFECDQRGVLATAGVAWSDEEIARAVGGDFALTLDCVRSVVAKGVAGRNQSGAVYSKRLLRDEENRKANSARQERFRGKKRVCNGHSNAHSNAPITPLSEEEGEDEEVTGKGVQGEGSDVDPPKGWPKTEVEARAWAGHVHPDLASKTWLLARTRGWHDAKNVPIRCGFKSFLESANAYERERLARGNGVGQPNESTAAKRFRLSKRIELLEGETHYEHDRKAHPGKVAELKRLKAEMEALGD